MRYVCSAGQFGRPEGIVFRDMPGQAGLRIALEQPLEPRHELPGDLVKPRLQFEHFIEFVDLPTERVVGGEQLAMDRHRAVRFPANTGWWHVFGIGVDAKGTGTLKTTLTGNY